jgi:hypothetical protein
MAREILTLNDIRKINSSGEALKMPPDATVPTGSDKYIDRLFKYIPAEIVAGYIFVLGIMTRFTDPVKIRTLHWILFLVFCLITPLYLRRIQKVRKLQQHIISLASFIVWVFALGGPFAQYNWYDPLYGEILLPVFTLIAAIWEAE